MEDISLLCAPRPYDVVALRIVWRRALNGKPPGNFLGRSSEIKAATQRGLAHHSGEIIKREI
jgi:hypothetical protein